MNSRLAAPPTVPSSRDENRARTPNLRSTIQPIVKTDSTSTARAVGDLVNDHGSRASSGSPSSRPMAPTGPEGKGGPSHR